MVYYCIVSNALDVRPGMDKELSSAKGNVYFLSVRSGTRILASISGLFYEICSEERTKRKALPLAIAWMGQRRLTPLVDQVRNKGQADSWTRTSLRTNPMSNRPCLRLSCMPTFRPRIHSLSSREPDMRLSNSVTGRSFFVH